MNRLFHRDYNEVSQLTLDELWPIPKACNYCHKTLAVCEGHSDLNFNESSWLTYYFCVRCGWWCIDLDETKTGFAGSAIDQQRYSAILKDLTPSDERIVALQLLRNELAANPDRARALSPRQLEEIVASVFRDVFECTVELTKQTRDGGVDMLGLDSSGGKFVVEVKRYSEHRKVGVALVRQLLGAMVFKNIHKGFLVTTSSFTKDAVEAAVEAPAEWHLVTKDIADLSDWFQLSFEKYFDLEYVDAIVKKISGDRGDSIFPRRWVFPDGKEYIL